MLEAVVFVARHDVPMRMVDRLSRGVAVVHFQVPTVASGGGADGRGEFFNGQRQGDKIVIGGDGDVLAVNFWNDQEVPGVDRIDVQERDDLFVFIDNINGYLFGDNFAKETIHIC